MVWITQGINTVNLCVLTLQIYVHFSVKRNLGENFFGIFLCFEGKNEITVYL